MHEEGTPAFGKMEKQLGDTEHKMWVMVVIMVLSSFLCFALGFFFAKREQSAAAAEAAAREEGYGLIFGDDTVQAKAQGSASGSFKRQPAGTAGGEVQMNNMAIN